MERFVLFFFFVFVVRMYLSIFCNASFKVCVSSTYSAGAFGQMYMDVSEKSGTRTPKFSIWK